MCYALGSIVFAVEDDVLAGCKVFGAEKVSEFLGNGIFAAADYFVGGLYCEVEELLGPFVILVVVLLPASFDEGPSAHEG